MIKDTSAQDRVLQQHNRLRVRGKWLVVVTALAIGGALFAPNLAALYRTDAQIRLQDVRLAQVERGDLQQDLAVTGRVVAADSPTLYAPEDGLVSLLVKAGDQVQPGQLLARIASPALDSEYQQALSVHETTAISANRLQIESKARLLELDQQEDIAAIELEAAERHMQRALLSKARHLLSSVEFEQVEVDLKKAQLAYQHAKENKQLEQERLQFELAASRKEVARQQLVVDELTRRLNTLAIHASFSGLVGNVSVNPKDAVVDNAPLLTLVDMRAFEVEVQIPEHYADDLGAGLDAEITLEGRALPATLTAISPEVIDGQVAARLRFTQMPQGLRQNKRVSARLIMDAKANVVKVKRGPFIEANAGRFAFLVNDNVAERRPIQLGLRGEGEVEVIGGLQPGDQIIISSLNQFQQSERLYLTQ